MKSSLITRLAAVEAALHPEAAWAHIEGLCDILAYSRQHPAPELGKAEVAARAAAGDGMAQLLLEAWRATSCEEECDGD
jgi:hypothetical protein